MLTAVPLCIALAQLAYNLNDLAIRSQVAVKRAELVGTVSRELRDAALAIERGVRQTMVSEDRTFLDDYARARQRFSQVLQLADALPLEAVEREAFTGLRKQDIVLAGALADGVPPKADRAAVIEAASLLSDNTDLGVQALDRVVAREIVALEMHAARGRADWPVMVGVAAVLALVLGLGFSVVVSRPLHSLDRSIRRMGEAKFDTPVTIKGPPDLRSLGERLEWLRKRLHDLESHQASFLRQVSHELKTPLTAIREGSELLNDRVTGDLSTEQAEVVKIIRENSLQLQKLITDLLTYQHHRSAVPLKLELVSLSSLVNVVIAAHRVPTLAKAITIRAHVLPIELTTDRERLRVILDNLFSNAVKFSPRGGQILLATRIINRQHLQIDISDQGPGVSLEEKIKIFESFYKGIEQVDANVKGTGLGLAIARDFALALGGDIEVVEAGAPGARFRVRLPIDPAQLPPEMPNISTNTQGQTP